MCSSLMRQNSAPISDTLNFCADLFRDLSITKDRKKISREHNSPLQRLDMIRDSTQIWALERPFENFMLSFGRRESGACLLRGPNPSQRYANRIHHRMMGQSRVVRQLHSFDLYFYCKKDISIDVNLLVWNLILWQMETYVDADAIHCRMSLIVQVDRVSRVIRRLRIV